MIINHYLSAQRPPISMLEQHRLHSRWLQTRDLLYNPLTFIEILLCFRLFTGVIGILSIEHPRVDLICDVFSIGIWLALVLLIGYEVARFEYHRWRCAKYKEQKRLSRSFPEGNDVALGRSCSIGNSGCYSLTQSFSETILSVVASCNSFPNMLRGRCLETDLNPQQSRSEQNYGDDEQPENDWKSRLLGILWRAFFVESHPPGDMEQGVVEMGEPRPNTIERLEQVLEAQPVAIAVDGATEPRDKHV